MPLLREITGDVALFVSLMIVPTICLQAQEPDAVRPHKSEYNLFNPTPLAAMRELSPDRPDKTESPHTVDAGHFQLEMDFVNFTYSDVRTGPYTRWIGTANMGFTFLLTHNVQLDLCCGFGATGAADAVNPFVGITVRY
jgi:hypothetical protein